jgi:hypothetical protein
MRSDGSGSDRTEGRSDRLEGARSDAGEAGLGRRELVKALGAAGVASLLPWSAAFAQPAADAAPAPVAETASRRAYAELLLLMQRIDQTCLAPARGIRSAEDVVDGHRFLTHALAGALDQYGERDAERPHFSRIVTPWRKFLGDNPDAVYFSAPVRADRAYRIRGNTAGAVYTSFTVEGGNADGSYPKRVVSALHDDQMQVAADGSYEIIASAERQPGNWLRLSRMQAR